MLNLKRTYVKIRIKGLNNPDFSHRLFIEICFKVLTRFDRVSCLIWLWERSDGWLSSSFSFSLGNVNPTFPLRASMSGQCKKTGTDLTQKWQRTTPLRKLPEKVMCITTLNKVEFKAEKSHRKTMNIIKTIVWFKTLMDVSGWDNICFCSRYI